MFLLKIRYRTLHVILIGTKTGKVSERSSETGLVLELHRPFHSQLYLRFLLYSQNRLGDGTDTVDGGSQTLDSIQNYRLVKLFHMKDVQHTLLY